MPYIDVPAGRIFATREGRGDLALLFVHGAAGSGTDWDEQVRALRADHVVVTMDVRGCGRSSVEDPAACVMREFSADVGRVMDALDLGPTVVVGHSMGTRVALQAAADVRARVIGVVLVDGSRYWSGSVAEAEQNVAQEYTDARARFRRMYHEQILDGLPDNVRERVISTMESTSPDVLLALATTTSQWDAGEIERIVSGLSVPLLAIQSTYHDVNTRRYSLQPGATTPYLEMLRRCKPDVEVAVVSGVGHYVMIEAADTVNQLIRDFASRLSPHEGAR